MAMATATGVAGDEEGEGDGGKGDGGKCDGDEGEGREATSKPYASPIRVLVRCAQDVHGGGWVWN